MDKIQDYLNNEYQKEHEDTMVLDAEELSLMNPKTAFDIEGFEYSEIYQKIKAIRAKIALLQDDINHCEAAINSNATPIHTKSELKNNIKENNFAIAFLENELRTLNAELEQKYGHNDGRTR